MATIDVLTFKIATDAALARRIVRALMPFVWLRLVSVKRATAIAMWFVKVEVTTVHR